MEVWTVCWILMMSFLSVCQRCPSLGEPARLSSAGWQDRGDVVVSNPPPGTDETDDFCFKHLCRCHGSNADCSGNAGNLSFIPKLRDNIRFLNFSHNGLTAIRGSSFFLNATHITALDLSRNKLTYLAPGVFHVVHNLRYLSLSQNFDLSTSSLPAVLAVTSLHRLDMMYTQLGPLPDDIFYKFPLPEMRQLYFSSNTMKHVNFSAFAPLQKVENLGLERNSLTYTVPGRLESLYTMTLRVNFLQLFPTTCDADGTSLFPRLQRLFLDENSIVTIHEDVCLPQLKLLELSHNRFTSLTVDSLKLHHLPHLVELYLEQMAVRVTEIGKAAFQNPSLERIVLMYNKVDFGHDDVHADCFAGCPKLTDLQLSHNFFSTYLSDEKMFRLFSNLTGLQYLYMENTELVKFPEVFSLLTAMEVMTFSQNSVRSIPDGVFDRMTKLRSLDMDNNQISVIRETTFSTATRLRLEHLDLSGNPFICSCDVMWFRGWLLSSPELFRHAWADYDCVNIAGRSVTSFHMAEQACLMSHDTYTFLAVTVAMLICTLTLVSLLFRYRWHFRLLLYEAFRGRGDTRRRRLQQQHFQYDVFVSYASDDLHWVLEHLMPELEGRLGLRLCIHERDFTPGRPIVDNIEESVQSSKKVLMVFSTHFAHSQWCQFELRLCLSHVMEQDDALLVVLLHDVPAHDMTSTMMAVLKTTTYIEWGEDPDAVASFWGRLQIGLTEILSCEACDPP